MLDLIVALKLNFIWELFESTRLLWVRLAQARKLVLRLAVLHDEEWELETDARLIVFGSAFITSLDSWINLLSPLPILFYFSSEFNLSVNLMINQRNFLLDPLIGLQVGVLELFDHVEVLAVMVLDVVAAWVPFQVPRVLFNRSVLVALGVCRLNCRGIISYLFILALFEDSKSLENIQWVIDPSP